MKVSVLVGSGESVLLWGKPWLSVSFWLSVLHLIAAPAPSTSVWIVPGNPGGKLVWNNLKMMGLGKCIGWVRPFKDEWIYIVKLKRVGSIAKDQAFSLVSHMQTLTKFRHDKGLREYKSSAKINSCNTRISHQTPPYSEHNRAQLTMFPNLKNKIKDLRIFQWYIPSQTNIPRCSMYGIVTSTLEVKVDD